MKQKFFFSLCLSFILAQDPVASPPTPDEIKKSWTAFLQKPLPQFTLFNEEGDEFTTPLWEGERTIYYFWATWCAPCIKKLPQLSKIYQEGGMGDFRLVYVNIQHFDVDKAFAWVKEKKYTGGWTLLRKSGTDWLPSLL